MAYWKHRAKRLRGVIERQRREERIRAYERMGFQVMRVEDLVPRRGRLRLAADRLRAKACAARERV